jgi:divalent metal cation (Fe/Co/Zn/Cd) transporter
VLPIPEWLVGRADAMAGLAVAAIALHSVLRLGLEAVRALTDDVSPALIGRSKDRVEASRHSAPLVTPPRALMRTTHQ